MDVSKELEQQLQDALTHVYDPDYKPSELLYSVTGCDPENGPISVQSAILMEIDGLKPDLCVPEGAHARRIYDVMYHRYVLKLTQEEAAEILNISVRHLNRVQREAVHALARTLWERGRMAGGPTDGNVILQNDQRNARGQALDWRSQARQELASLHTSAPDIVSDVEEAIGGLLDLQDTLASSYGVHLEIGFIQHSLVAAIHPSVLRQILIAAVWRLARFTAGGSITIFAGLKDGQVRITITGTVAAENEPLVSSLVRDIVTPENVHIDVQMEGAIAFLRVVAPSVGRITVLVVEDNPDMVHFYRRSTAGTRYHIVHAIQGQPLIETVQDTSPDVIVLDVMLPDIDGWKLLMQLREDPRTRAIPLIVCSVIKEEDLALSLGAALHLPKPVRRSQFIQALDRVLAPASTGWSTAQENN